jgi:hypothetical protein
MRRKERGRKDNFRCQGDETRILSGLNSGQNPVLPPPLHRLDQIATKSRLCVPVSTSIASTHRYPLSKQYIYYLRINYSYLIFNTLQCRINENERSIPSSVFKLAESYPESQQVPMSTSRQAVIELLRSCPFRPSSLLPSKHRHLPRAICETKGCHQHQRKRNKNFQHAQLHFVTTDAQRIVSDPHNLLTGHPPKKTLLRQLRGKETIGCHMTHGL